MSRPDRLPGRARAPELLVTERLVLRRPVEDDVSAIFERYASDPEVTRYLAWPRHVSLDDTRIFIAFSDADPFVIHGVYNRIHILSWTPTLSTISGLEPG